MEQKNEWTSILDLQELNKVLQSIFPENSVSVEDLLNRILSGKVAWDWKQIKDMIFSVFWEEWLDVRHLFLIIVGILFLENLIQNVEEIFGKKELRQVSEYIWILSLIGVLIKAFGRCKFIAEETTDQVIEFIRVIIPAYFITIGSMNGIVTVNAFFHLILLVISIVEQIFVRIMIPFVQGYIALQFINSIVGEEQFIAVIQIVEKIINLIMRITISCIMAMGVLQSIITPTIANINRNLLEKTIAVIPGIGDASESVTSLLTGSAMLIKNTLGVFTLLILIFMCGFPVMRICLIGGTMKIAATISSICGKSNMWKCVNRIGDGCLMMARLIFTVGLLFFVIIAMIAFATNK